MLELDAIDEEVKKQLKTYKQNKKKIEKISLELESLEKSRLRMIPTKVINQTGSLTIYPLY